MLCVIIILCPTHIRGLSLPLGKKCHRLRNNFMLVAALSIIGFPSTLLKAAIDNGAISFT